jgi:hypothetical protein
VKAFFLDELGGIFTAYAGNAIAGRTILQGRTSFRMPTVLEVLPARTGVRVSLRSGSFRIVQSNPFEGGRISGQILPGRSHSGNEQAESRREEQL